MLMWRGVIAAGLRGMSPARSRLPLRALSAASSQQPPNNRSSGAGVGRPSFNAGPPQRGPAAAQPPQSRPTQQQQGQAAQLIYNVTGSDFKQIVLDSPVPVILDCWAEWCGPCRQLGPVLEAAVKAQNGKVRMAKLDTDQNPQLAQQLGVKSLPTVMLVNEGKLVDQFVGNIGEQKVKEFVVKAAGLSKGTTGANKHDPNDLVSMQAMVASVIELLKVAAQPRAAGEEPEISKEEMADMITALRTLAGHKLDPLPPNTQKTAKRRADEDALEMIRGIAYAGLTRCALLDGNAQAAKEITTVLKNSFPKSVLEHPEVKSAMSLATLTAGAAGGASDEARNKLEARIKQNPGDLDARLELAKALFAEGAHGQAIEQALDLLKRDRTFKDGAARSLLIDIFNALGSTDIVKDARRRMSSILMN